LTRRSTRLPFCEWGWTVADKSKDLAPDRARCHDEECPAWAAGCARAEVWKGEGRYVWLPLCTRECGAWSCPRRIDPVTLEEGE